MTVAVRPPRSLRIQIAQFQQFKRYVSPPNKPLLTICVMGTLGVPLQVVQCHSKAKVSTFCCFFCSLLFICQQSIDATFPLQKYLVYTNYHRQSVHQQRSRC